MYKKVLSYIRKNNLIQPKDKILIALSGGPDSICLLNILFKLKEKLDITIAAAHLNHLLRGEDALEDEKYVDNVCKTMGIECFIKRVDINAYAKEHKLSSEMAGRIARYDFFDHILKKEGFNKIATAHNANDQAETILFRIMRGTGLEGLSGIKVSRDDKVIRPILCLDRSEVEKYVQIKKLTPRIDKTNFEKIYNRNKIRLDILPYIKDNFNEDIINTLNRMALLLQKDNEFLEKLSLSLYNKYCVEYDDYFIIKKDIFKQEEVLINRVIRRVLTNYSNSNYDFEMKHIYEVFSLSQKQSGKTIDLPNGVYAENVYENIYIKNKKTKNILDRKNDKKQEIIIDKKDIYINVINFYNYNFKLQVINNFEKSNIDLQQKENFIKYFDFDKINKNILIRNRKNGDKIIPIGMNGSKKIKDIFINEKIPKDARDSIPILCFDNKISWVVGVRASEEYKITPKSKNVLKIIVERKEY